MVYIMKREGSFGQHDFMVKAYKTEKHEQMVSLWHDVPLFVNSNELNNNDENNSDSNNENCSKNILNYVCEIPKGTRDKFEISTSDPGNVIKQDLDKNGNLRQYKRGDVFFNYGALPRTWEDPSHLLDVELEHKVGGDNDPLDVCEIGLRKHQIGEIRKVKVLGVLCMIDDGEADWKIIAIDIQDPWASSLNDIEDVEKHLPGVLDDIRHWWRVYKVAEGKPENRFGFGERFLNQKFAMDVVQETHKFWQNMVKTVLVDKKESPLAHCGKNPLHVSMQDVEALSALSDNAYDVDSSESAESRGVKRQGSFKNSAC